MWPRATNVQGEGETGNRSRSWPGPCTGVAEGPYRIHGLHISGKNQLNLRLQSQIETDVSESIVIRNFFGKSTEINKKSLTDSKYYLPVDHVIIVDRDVSEPDGFPHGYASN
jgi:hypothetical protein